MIKTKLTAILTVLTISVAGPSLVPVSTVYADCPAENSSKGQVIKGIGEAGGTCDDSGVSNLLSTIVSILSYVAGIAAIIMIVLSGFKYITSAGDSGKVSAAKTTLIYALIGLAVAALAQFLVHFVLTAATTEPPKPCPAGNHRSEDGKKCIPD